MKSLLFVDDEPRVLQGLERQLHSRRHEWTMSFAESGSQALEFMASNPVDVIVSDMVMPAMDGAQLLTTVSERYPRTIRLVLSGHADREAVLRLVGPAHQYLSKPCDPEELQFAITRAFAMRELLGNERLKELTSRIRCLPSLPPLHVQLSDELRKAEPCVERVAEIISQDVGMTTKILQLVNSAFFGLAQPTTNVTEAVVYLGLATLRALALSIQVFSQFDARTLREFKLERVAEHCWNTGMMARRIAECERCQPRVEDQCFLAGLLHDVGTLILAAGVPDLYRYILERAAQLGCSVQQVEMEELGASHSEVGAYLLGLWGLPSPVVEAVALHHRPADCSTRGFSAVVAVHAADAFAQQAEAGGKDNDLDLNCLSAFGLDSRVDLWKARCFRQN